MGLYHRELIPLAHSRLSLARRRYHRHYIVVYVCVCVTDLFSSFYFYMSRNPLFSESIPEFSTTPSFFPPLVYANPSVSPYLRQLLLSAPACSCPPPSTIVRAARQLPCSLASGYIASGYLASGGLIPATVLAVTSLPHLPDTVSGGCTPPCTWRHGG